MHLRKYDFVTMSSGDKAESGGGIHPYHEILYISSGNVLLYWMGKEYAVEAPALFLLAPNTPHFLLRKSAASNFIYLELDMQNSAEFPVLAQMLVWNHLQTSDNRYNPELSQVYTSVLSLLEFLSPHYPYKKAGEQIAMLEISKILLLIKCYFSRPVSDPRQLSEQAETQVRIQALIRYMESHYADPITVNTLAAYAHLDLSYFIRLFRSIAGKTPLQYLLDLRLSAATCFLSTTNMSVQDIAAATGFQSVHYFSRQFKQSCGYTPTQWRQQERKQWTTRDF